MGHPWSESAEAFVLSQLRQTANFWRLGRAASYSLEVKPEGGATLVTRFQLPQPSDHLPPPRPHILVNSSHNSTRSPVSKTRDIPSLFPFGLPMKRQDSRRPAPVLPIPRSTQPRPQPQPHPQPRRDHVRAVLHHAHQATPKPVLPGTLRALAVAALPRPAPPHSLPAPAPDTSTPKRPLKRRRTSSSPPDFRQWLMTDCTIIESASDTSLHPSPERLREGSPAPNTPSPLALTPMQHPHKSFSSMDLSNPHSSRSHPPKLPMSPSVPLPPSSHESPIPGLAPKTVPLLGKFWSQESDQEENNGEEEEMCIQRMGEILEHCENTEHLPLKCGLCQELRYVHR